MVTISQVDTSRNVVGHYSPISRDQKFTRRNPCPVCGGGDDDKRHQGIRCHGGFLSNDGRFAFCGNPGYARGLPERTTSAAITWKHRLDSPCNCGGTHDGATFSRPADIHGFRTRPTVDAAPAPTRAHTRRTPEMAHVYRTADGAPYLRVIRWGTGKEKRILQQRPDGAGDWYDGLNGLTPILYRLPELLAADPWAPVFIVEGEKCADALAALGEVVTTNLGGAGKWANTPNRHEPLRGRSVVILGDNDPVKPDRPSESEKGQRNALEIAADVAPVAASVRIVDLPGLPEKGDVYDWLAMGHTGDELRQIAAATPVLVLGSHEARNQTQRGQDAAPEETQKTGCANCERLGEQLRITETSLMNLRQEQAWARQVLALPKEQLSPALKPAAIAVYSVLKQPRMRDEQGMEPVYRAQIARACGVSDDSAGAQLRKLADAGVIKRDVIRRFDYSEIRISEGPLFDTPAAIPASEATWGGKRERRCTHCGSSDLETRYLCRGCGSLLTPEETEIVPVGQDSAPDAPEEDTTGEGASDAGQDHPSPAYIIVPDLAPNAQETPDTGRPVAALDAAQTAVRELAKAKGWPRVQLHSGAHTGGNEALWQRFISANPPDRIAAAHRALLALPVGEASGGGGGDMGVAS